MKLRIYGSCKNVNVKVFIESGIQKKRWLIYKKWLNLNKNEGKSRLEE